MTVAEAAGRLGGALVAGVPDAGREVLGGYAYDLLSDVMGNAREGDLWVTLQKHVNVVAVAQLKGLAGIVLVAGREPERETVARADQEHVPLVTTALPAFEAVGVLHGAGVTGLRGG